MRLFYHATSSLFLALLLMIGLTQVTLGQDKLYWTEAGIPDGIVRSDLDGTNVEVIVSTGLQNPAGIAVDPLNGKVYWTDTQADAISRADLDGSNVETLVSTGLVTPAGIVLDLIANKMYWIDQGNDTIKRANLDGSGIETLISTGLDIPFDLILNYGPGNTLGANQMYWTDQGDDTIKRANTDGTGVITVVDDLNNPHEVELDLTAGKIYWTESAGNVVGRANLDGTNREIIIDGSASALIETPAALAINKGSASPAQGGDRLYVSSRNTPDAMLQANLDGTNLTTINTTSVDFVNFLDIGPAVVLPVELTTFDALVERGVVHLTWTTASETNNAGFEIQTRHGTGGAWENIGFVDGAGTTAEPRAYAYRITDLMPGTHIFRLKQVDFDGTFEYSPLVRATVELPGTHALSGAFPNPFRTATTLTLAVARDQQVQVGVFDLNGRRVATLHNGLLTAGTAHPLTFYAADLPAGPYLFRASGTLFEETRTVVLVR